MPPKKKDEHDTWPYGQETIGCPLCGGSGLDRKARDEYIASRVDYGSGTRPSISCLGCGGRGRILAAASSARAAAR